MRKSVHEATGHENLKGIIRKTLVYNDEVMLCHFHMAKGAEIPLHNHRASQVGYVMSGVVRFLGNSEEDAFEARAGDSYVFDPHQTHGAIALEDAELTEVFSPAREEYKD